MAPKTFPFTFNNVYVRRKDRVVLVATDDESMLTDTPVSTLMLWDGDSWMSQVSCQSNGTAFALLANPETHMMLGKEGNVYLWGEDGELHKEQIDPTPHGPQNYGDLEDIRVIDGCAYVAGIARTVYVRGRNGIWKAIDQGIRDESKADVGFFSIDGFNENELYAVGLEGQIAVYFE